MSNLYLPTFCKKFIEWSEYGLTVRQVTTASGYHQRSIAENGMYRLKQLFGNHLTARLFESLVTEVLMRIAAMNIMTALRMPVSVRLGIAGEFGLAFIYAPTPFKLSYNTALSGAVGNRVAVERLKLYLNNYNDWDNKDDVSFHKNFPEFTIRSLKHNLIYDGNETREWARGKIGYHYASGNHTRQEVFSYHRTLMTTLLIVVFDGGKKIIVSPDWQPIGNGRIYHYLRDSLDYTYQKFITSAYGGNDYSGRT